MNFNIHSIKDENSITQHVIIEGDVGVNFIDQVKMKIESIQIDGREIIIDLKNIESFDISSVQLMYSLKKTLGDQGKSVELKSEFPENIIILLRNSGFEEIINT